MVLFKVCVRCKGDMHMDRDIYGEYGKCLQCGFMIDIDKNQHNTVGCYRGTPVSSSSSGESSSDMRPPRNR